MNRQHAERAALRPGRWFRSHRRHVLLAYLLLLIPAIVLITRLKSDNAIERWLNPDDPAMIRYERFRREFHVPSEIVAVLEDVPGDDARVEQLAARLESSRLVQRVWTPQRLQGVTGRSGGGAGRDSRHATVTIELTEAAARNGRETIDLLQHITRMAGFDSSRVHWGGPAVVNAALDRWGQQSTMHLLPIVALVSALSLWILTGHFRQSCLLVLSSAIAVLTTLAVMQAFGGSMNLLMVALPPLVGVLHLSMGLHFLHHFNATAGSVSATQSGLLPAESPAVFLSREEAVDHALRSTFLPSCLAAFTTIVGMISLALSDLQPVRGFGIWSSAGIGVSLVVVYSLLPCLLFGVQPKAPAILSGRWISRRFFVRRLAIFAVFAAGFVVSCAGWPRLRAEFNALRFLPENCRTLRDYRWIENRQFGLVPLEFVVDLRGMNNPAERFRRLRHLSQTLQQQPSVTRVLSLSTFLPENFSDELVGAVIRSLDQSESNASLMENWVTRDGFRYRITALIRSDDPHEVSDLEQQLRRSFGKTPVEITGLVSLIERSQQEIFRSLRNSLLMSGVLIGLLLIAVLRSLPAGLVTLIPNVLPIALAFGLLGWSGVAVGVGTVLTASIALGIALDDSLHFLHQFRKARAKSSSLGRCVRRAWSRCARPMFQTSMVISAGLSPLLASHFQPVAQFGGLLIGMVLVALLGDLVLFPNLLTTPLARFFTGNSRQE